MSLFFLILSLLYIVSYLGGLFLIGLVIWAAASNGNYAKELKISTGGLVGFLLALTYIIWYCITQ